MVESSCVSIPTLPISHGFHAAYGRLRIAAKVRTQAELAAVLNVTRSAISDAKRRECIPVAWLRLLLVTARVPPLWILCGMGPDEVTADTMLDEATVTQILHEIGAA